MYNAIKAPICMDGETLQGVIAQSLFCPQVLVRPDVRQGLRGVGRSLHRTTSAVRSLDSLCLRTLVFDAAGLAWTVEQFASIFAAQDVAVQPLPPGSGQDLFRIARLRAVPATNSRTPALV